jgi:G3E family GTPase
MSVAPPRPMPVPMTVVTGFLGSGKTTLIANLLRRPELSRTAVIINEFGEIGLDHELIESSEEDLVELSTGCLCCVMRGDLTNAVRRLMDKRAEGRGFERIVLETTGLADPAPIVHAAIADPALRALVRLDRVAVTVDALTALTSLDAHEESRSQVAQADVLLITKTDLGDDDVGALLERTARINPDAAMHFPVRGEIEPAVIIGGNSRSTGPFETGSERAPQGEGNSGNYGLTLRRSEGSSRRALPDHHGHHHHHGHGPDEITSVSLRLETPIPAVALTLFLQALAETMGPDLLRLKGIVEVAEAPDTPAVVHGVRHVFHPMRWLDDWPGGSRDSRLVLIGKRISEPWIRALLETITEEVAEASGQ